MKYYCIAGEPSGDSHTASLVQNIKMYDRKATFRGFGGVAMEESGVTIDRHLSYLSFMGFTNVIFHLFTIINNFRIAKNKIKAYKPDIVILTDYPGFNLRMAKWCKKNGYKVIYYISPQIWAWKYNRIYTIRKYIDKMLCILPFEKDIYTKEQVEAHYVRHPLLDKISININIQKEETIALFPGSRTQEIRKHLPILLDIANQLPAQGFKLAGISSYHYPILPSNITLVIDDPYDVLLKSRAAIISSGTATLEAALLNIPTVVIYKTNTINYFIARYLVKLKWISLVNILANKNLFPECIQSHCNEREIIQKLNYIESQDINYRNMMIEAFKAHPIEDAAKIIHDYCAKKDNANR